MLTKKKLNDEKKKISNLQTPIISPRVFPTLCVFGIFLNHRFYRYIFIYLPFIYLTRIFYFFILHEIVLQYVLNNTSSYDRNRIYFKLISVTESVIHFIHPLIIYFFFNFSKRILNMSLKTIIKTFNFCI